jgi:hypothetical protein
LRAAGLIESAMLVCQGWFATDDAPPQLLAAATPSTSLDNADLLLA